ncbi:MAG: IS21 family transposase [Chloroflexota bacterium]
MAYREVHRMHVDETARRHAAGQSLRAIARATGLARNTVAKYLRGQPAATASPGALAASATATTVTPGRFPCPPGPPAGRYAPALAVLVPHRERIAAWLAGTDRTPRLRLTRILELLAPELPRPISYNTLRRFIAAERLGTAPPTTVRMPESPPGDLVEVDFGRLGVLVDQATGRRRQIWALVLVLGYSRHSFVWPLYQQTLAATIEGLEAAWQFFGGMPQRLVSDNFPAAVAGPDPYQPRLTRGLLEYSQARGILVDPARVAHPKDKPKVERMMQYVRDRFWKGGSFRDLADARSQARAWCVEVAGQRVHGTTRRVPLAVFDAEERAQLQPAPTTLYDTPRWADVTVHPDHHISFEQALYSVPCDTCPPGTRLEVRGDRDLVRIYQHGTLVQTWARAARGQRQTDVAHYPAEESTYALRSTDRLIALADRYGTSVGEFTRRLLGGPVPWSKIRQAQKLVRLCEQYGAARLEPACARALAFDLVEVRRVERIVQLALEREQTLPLPWPSESGPPDSGTADQERVRALPPGRFARGGESFAHAAAGPDQELGPELGTEVGG